MLKSLRTGSQSLLVKIVLSTFLFMALAGLVVMDVQGVFSSGVTNSTVASVGRYKISAADFEEMVDKAMRAQQIPRDIGLLMGIPRQVLTQELNSRVFAMAAQDMGLIPDDVAAAKNLEEVLGPYVKDGMTRQAALQRFLTTTGMSEDQLVATVKTRLAVSTMTGLLTAGARAPDILVADTVRYNFEKRRAEYFVLDAADVKAPPAPTEEQLQDYYKTAGAQFALPEYRTLDVIKLDTIALGLEQEITDDAINTYYESRKAEFTRPETRVIEQAVVKDEETAKTLHAAAAASGNLKAATEKTEGANYLAPEKLAELDMPEELSPAAFAAEEGAFPAPVQTPFGWHVLHVTKVNPGVVQPLDAVRKQIREALTSNQAASALYDEANKIDDLLAGGAFLDEIAQQYSLKPVTIKDVSATGETRDGKPLATDLPEIGSIIATAFKDLREGETSQLIETPDGDAFLLVSVREITPSAVPPFKDVRAKVVEAWKKKETAQAVERRAKEADERLRNGEPFAKVAAAFGKKPVSTGLVPRTPDAKDIAFDMAIVTALFKLDKPGTTTVVPGKGAHIALRYAERQLGDPKGKSKEDLTALATALDRSMQETILNEYREVLVQEYDVTVNEEVLTEIYRPRGDMDMAEGG